jgi:hypothetical protein
MTVSFPQPLSVLFLMIVVAIDWSSSPLQEHAGRAQPSRESRRRPSFDERSRSQHSARSGCKTCQSDRMTETDFCFVRAHRERGLSVYMMCFREQRSERVSDGNILNYMLI